jgi:hypothetical protein
MMGMGGFNMMGMMGMGGFNMMGIAGGIGGFGGKIGFSGELAQ